MRLADGIPIAADDMVLIQMLDGRLLAFNPQ